MKILVDFGNDQIKIEAEVTVDGDKWCVSAGDFAIMPAGFGNTITSAVWDFQDKVRNGRPPKAQCQRPNLTT